jgi:hypothetical protein
MLNATSNNISVILLWCGRRGRDRMVVGFTTTYAISAHHQRSCEFEYLSGEVYSIQHYVITIDSYFITEILLKVAPNTITLPIIPYYGG